jgi:hypothetical protein
VTAVTTEALGTTGPDPEWARVELLCRLAERARNDEPPDDESLDRLQALQLQVEHGRMQGHTSLPPAAGDLSPIELDVLACVLAVEAEPRIGWLFHALQPWSAQPYPTPALLQELLTFDEAGKVALHEALAPEGELRRRGLIETEALGTYAPIRPGTALAAHVLGRPATSRRPPGTRLVKLDCSRDDLVLPTAQARALDEYVGWIRQRDRVQHAWGARRYSGPTALFWGAAGTGKTFAAAVLANQLGWPLYRIDLGSVISKYVGETERNLNLVLDSVHGQAAMLQFDEAEGLFGRRGEIRDARDRYANLEVSHLLARLEDHDGPCILTTNLRDNLDPAFLRRFQSVINFPRPDAAARTQLWERLLPPRAPREPDLDIAMIGAAVSLTGGAIHNAALFAAVLAAEDDRPISLQHVAVAVWRETSKDGPRIVPASLGPLAAHLPEWLCRQEGP